MSFHGAIALTMSALLTACVPLATGSQVANGYSADGAQAATIPFTLVGQHIYIHATVNGAGPYRFIVDTGGVNLIDAGLVKPLSLKITGKETGHGVGPYTIETGKTTIDRLTVVDIVFNQQKAYTYDFNQLYGSGGVEIEGMIVEEMEFRVVTVANVTPASEAGLRTGDLIVAIGGRPASSFTLPAIRDDDLRKWPLGSIILLK